MKPIGHWIVVPELWSDHGGEAQMGWKFIDPQGEPKGSCVVKLTRTAERMFALTLHVSGDVPTVAVDLLEKVALDDFRSVAGIESIQRLPEQPHATAPGVN